MKFRCCKPLNAEIDPYVGCNTEGPLSILSAPRGFLKDPYDPVKGCPRDAVTAFIIQSAPSLPPPSPFQPPHAPIPVQERGGEAQVLPLPPRGPALSFQ